MTLNEPLIAELQREAPTTRRMLERVPGDRFGWQPHAKSMTLGRLATHIAELPGMGTRICTMDELVISAGPYQPRIASRVADVLELFDGNVTALVSALAQQSDQRMASTWRMRRGDTVIRELARGEALRSVCFSHLIHHRGQLSVYLRLLDIPLPPVYGPTADEGR